PHYAPRPDVGALVDLLTLGLFRSHVSGGSENHTDLGRANVGCRRSFAFVRERPCQTEIEQFHDAVWCDLYVFWLQIPMDDAFFMRIPQRIGNLQSDLPGILKPRRAAWRVALHQLHY